MRRSVHLCITLSLLPLTLSTRGEAGDNGDWEATANGRVLDHVSNPILRPSDPLEWILGDPTVVTFPEQDEVSSHGSPLYSYGVN